MSDFPLGVSADISGPTTYTMSYLNGPINYTERFAVITYGSDYVTAAGAVLNAAVTALAAALEPVAGVGSVMSAIAGIGEKWIGSAVLNDDGSLTLQFAYHYCGTPNGGVDVTARPIPGVNAGWWQSNVNSLMAGLQPYVNLSMESTGAQKGAVVTRGRTPQGNAPHAAG